jgi:ABC-2 type transport system permease protein
MMPRAGGQQPSRGGPETPQQTRAALRGERAAVHAEWTKLRTAPATPWLLLAVVVTTVALGVSMAALVTDDADPVRSSLIGVQLGQAVVAILAVQMMGSEYSSGMIHTTLAAIPRRVTVLSAKAVILTGVVLVAGAVAVAGSLVFSPLDLSHGPILRAAFGSVLYLALIALVSLGLAAALRNAAAAMGLALGLFFVVPLLIPALSDPDWQRHALQIAPTVAGLAIQSTTGLAALPISPWRGLAVLSGWAVAALLTGGLLLQRRDA